MNFIATCPKYLEDLAENEIKNSGAEYVKQGISSVFFSGTLETAYKICLWSRIINRVLLSIHTFEANSTKELYKNAKKVKWSEHLNSDSTFAVDCNLSNSEITHSHYAALIVKDAVVDYFRDKEGIRPSVNTDLPDIRLNLHIRNNQVNLSIDLSGNSLHQRSYRNTAGIAPLKENIAAAMLYRANWIKISSEHGILIDPMCGSGTILIEAALMAGNIAPGIYRKYYGFLGWKGHNENLWNNIFENALENKEKNSIKIPQILGFDENKKAVISALDNIETAGFSSKIIVKQCNIDKIEFRENKDTAFGLIISNPPYGERLEHQSQIHSLYNKIGNKLQTDFKGYKAAFLTKDDESGKYIGIKAYKVNKINNGPIKCRLVHFDLCKEIQFSGIIKEPDKLKESDLLNKLNDNTLMLFNRIKKNIKQLKKWAKKENITCYRIYDADLPEYSAAIDIFENKWLHIQEYSPPKTIPQVKTEKRLNDILFVVSAITGIPYNNIYLKKRSRQKGTSQYNKLNTSGKLTKIKENNMTFLLNFTDYLDVGIFLDHRPIRMFIKENSKNKRFLNLFSYTATATVYAVKGGAKSSFSIDLSNTYTKWAEKNFIDNDIDLKNNKLIKDDCVSWLKNNHTIFDLILLDPPTFSNSKSTDNYLDIQKDHIYLIKLALKHLSKDGILIFSNNFKRFKLDSDKLDNVIIEDISQNTIPFDYKRSKKIHYCWLIRKK